MYCHSKLAARLLFSEHSKDTEIILQRIQMAACFMNTFQDINL